MKRTDVKQLRTGSPRSIAGLLLCIAFLATACAEEQEDRFSDLAPASPMELSTESVGVGLHHGEALGLATSSAGSMQRVASVMDHAFFRVKSYDEMATVAGEYYSHSISGDFDIRDGGHFSRSGNPQARLGPRGDDLVEELDLAMQESGASGLERHSFVVDFWRESGDWFVRWDGQLNGDGNSEGVGDYGFGNQQMVDDLLDHLEAVASVHNPAWIVVGDSMDRLVAGIDDEEGISREEFDLFFEFFEKAVARIHDASADTRVAAGFHLENLAGPVATSLTEVENEDLGEPELDEVFQEYVIPFFEAGDAVALRSYVDADEMQSWHYQFLRRLSVLYGVDDLIFYSIGSPVDSRVDVHRQGRYLDRFLEYAGGVDAEVVAWERLTNIGGADTGDQSIIGRCRAMTSETGYIRMALNRCFDGLATTLDTKAVFENLETLLQK